MEELARKYARKILLAHLLLLAIVILIVVVAAREVYNQAKIQAKTQFLEKQSLLAQQTSNAIEAHYQAIVSSLDIVERQDTGPRAGIPALQGPNQNNLLANAAQLLGHQLIGPSADDRVETLMLIGLVGTAPNEPPPPQPGGGMQPGGMQPGMMQPGMMQPGMMQPGMMPPGFNPPPTTRPATRPATQSSPTSARGARGELIGRGVNPMGRIGMARGPGRTWTPYKPDQLIFLEFYPETRVSNEREYRDMVTPFIRSIESPTINSSSVFLKGIGNLIIYPSKLQNFRWQGRGNNSVYIQEVWLGAVVPIQTVKTRYLDDLTRNSREAKPQNKSNELIAVLADDEGRILAVSESEYHKDLYRVGDDLLSSAGHPEIAKAISSSNHFVEQSFITSDGELATLEPVPVCDKKWHLLILSPASKIDGMVGSVFKKAVWWSVLLVLGMSAILVSSSTTMIRSRLRLETLRNEMLSRDLLQARKIQLAWLPQTRGNLPIDVAAVNQPANHVSGDFYDWFMLPDGRVVVTIGDVTGHGMSAAFLMATSQILIKNTMIRVLDPGQCLTEVNRQLCGQVFFGQFVSACILVIDPAHNTLQVASAGHFDPILYTDSGLGKIEVDSQLVLGIEPTEVYPTTRLTLPNKYFILLYTDGIIDARSTAGEPYGNSRLRNDYVPLGSADLTLQTLLKAVADFQKGADPVDDITLVAIQSPCPNLNAQN